MRRLSVIPALALSLAACAGGDGVRSYRDDALPSPQVTAFIAADRRLGWRNAQIEYDGGCAVYRGFTPDDERRTEPLKDAEGRPICPR